MEGFYAFLNNNSHEIYCWSWAIFVSLGCIGFVVIIGHFWDKAYITGYEKGHRDALGFDS